MNSSILPSQKNYKRILKAIEIIKSQDASFSNTGVWVCVGSSVINANKIGSDVDLLFFTNKINDFKKFQGVDSLISACLVPEHMLVEDSFRGKYGGYFAAKLFNPYLIIEGQDSLLTERVIQAPAVHFLPFINYLLKTDTRATTDAVDYDTLTALALSVYFDLNPYFEGWWIRLWALRNYESIWEYVVKQFSSSLRAAGAAQNNLEIRFKNIDNVSMAPITSREEYNFTAFERGVNHWGFGILAHHGDFSFLDWAHAKAEYNIAKHGGYNGNMYRSMIEDISKRAHLQDK